MKKHHLSYIFLFERVKPIVATSRLALRWMCDSPRTGCARIITTIYMWREQKIIEWSRRVISIVACCHSAKLCAHAARAFRYHFQQKEIAKDWVKSLSTFGEIRVFRRKWKKLHSLFVFQTLIILTLQAHQWKIEQIDSCGHCSNSL